MITFTFSVTAFLIGCLIYFAFVAAGVVIAFVFKCVCFMFGLFLIAIYYIAIFIIAILTSIIGFFLKN